MECKFCHKVLNKNQKRFCSSTCTNRYNARLRIVQSLKDNKKSKECKSCHKRKVLNDFSYNIRGNLKSGHKDICKRCGATIRESKRRSRSWIDDAKEILLSGAKQRAKRDNLEFNINYDDIHIPEKCPIFGYILRREERNSWKFAPSLDRIDNTKGYIKGNIIVVSRRANILKKDASLIELQQLAEFYKQFIP